MNKNKINKIIIGVLLVVIIFVVYLSAQKDETKTNQNSQNINTEKTVLSENEDNVKEFVVSGYNFGFSLNEIEVNKGDKVRIIFKNDGGLHDWRIDELNVATKMIQTGEEDVIEFIADKVGEFEYYCSVGNHRDLGMRGRFIVK